MKIREEENRIIDRILGSKMNWWHGLMIFSGLFITFLSTQDESSFSVLLIFLYFIIATISIFLIFKTESVYDYIQKNYKFWTSKGVSEEEEQKNLKLAEKNYEIVNIFGKILKRITCLTIILTFLYFLNLYYSRWFKDLICCWKCIF